MAQGKEQSARRNAVGQAAVFFTQADVQQFIRTGVLEEIELGRVPYSPEAMEKMSRNG